MTKTKWAAKVKKRLDKVAGKWTQWGGKVKKKQLVMGKDRSKS